MVSPGPTECSLKFARIHLYYLTQYRYVYNSQGLRNLCALYTGTTVHCTSKYSGDLNAVHHNTSLYHFTAYSSPPRLTFLLLVSPNSDRAEKCHAICGRKMGRQVGAAAHTHNTHRSQSCFRCPPLGAPPVLTSLLLPPPFPTH